MATSAYSLDNVFSISGERQIPASQFNPDACIGNAEAEPRGCSYVHIDELVEPSRAAWEGSQECESILGSSPALSEVLRQVQTVACTDATVLIEGETGTGKELIAHAVHKLSRRRAGPFMKMNCAAIPAALLESELFGHEKGAFTGAVANRQGRFEAAHGGTLFLDEIGDFPLELQPKLLRVLQEQEFERLGSSYTRRVNVRVVAATNQDLAGMVAEKQFRMDLYYRLNVFPIALPPLRTRSEDLRLLAAHFTQKFAKLSGKQISKISSQDMDALSLYPWPGNIRELQNLIERAVILTRGDVLHVPALPCRSFIRPEPVTLKEAEREHILNALDNSKWVVGGTSGAAARLGMKRTTLIDRMRRLGLARGAAQTRTSV